MVGAVIVIAICARAYRLGAESLWADEAASWAFANLSISELWSHVPEYEANPPLYYTLLKCWSFLFGDGERALRSLSAVMSTFAVAMVYFIGRAAVKHRREGMWVGLIAALVMALHPVQIRYAQEARPFALETLGASMALLSLVSWLRTPELLSGKLGHILTANGSKGWLLVALFVLGCDLALWSHYTSLLLLGITVCASVPLLLISSRDRVGTLRNLIVLGAVIFVLWLPGAIWMVNSLVSVRNDFWIEQPTIHDAAKIFDYVLGSAGTVNYLLGYVGVAKVFEAQVAAVATAVAIAMAGALQLMLRQHWTIAVLLCAAVALPMFVSFGASFVITPIFLARTLIWVEVAAAVLIAAAFLWLPRPWARVAVTAVLVGCLLVAMIPVPKKEPWRDIVTILERESRSNDMVVVWPSFANLPLSYYDFARRVRTRRPKLWFDTQTEEDYPSIEQTLSRRQMPTEEVLSRILAQEADGGRVWLIARTRMNNETFRRIDEYLTSERGVPQSRVRKTGSVRLLLYPAKESIPE